MSNTRSHGDWQNCRVWFSKTWYPALFQKRYALLIFLKGISGRGGRVLLVLPRQVESSAGQQNADVASPWERVGCRLPAAKGHKSFRGRPVCDSLVSLTYDRKLLSEGEQSKQ